MTKRCAHCKQIKSLDSFGVDKRWNIPRSWCKQCSKQKAAEYRKTHPEKVKAAISKYHKNNREKHRLRNRNWRKNNPEKAKLARRNWYKRKENKIATCLRNRLYECLNGKLDGKSTWEVLGYNCKDFMQHIESQFRDGMNWHNHGKWEFDHIIPISFFEFESPDDVEFKMCWRLENIRPAWKHTNRTKTNKILAA